MAFRDDITVDWTTSPRIVTIAAPSTEVTLQDLVDTLRELEQQPANMVYEQLVDNLKTGGKQPLGGSVYVGITATLNNAQVAFEARTAAAESGTVTSAGVNILTDSAADFVSAGVQRGSVVVNFDDGSVSDVLDVIDANNLLVVGLVEGSENDFDVGEAYAVWNIEQVTVTGGNLVAIDDVGAEMAPVLPTFGTQVERTASSSATLQELEAVQYASYGGGVTVDILSSNTGTAFPVGTPQAPVNNFSDALGIAAERGFSKFFVIGDATVDSGLDYSDFKFVGQGSNLTTLTLASAGVFTNCQFEHAKIEGTLDGDSVVEDCEVGNLTFITGLIRSSVLAGTITLGGSTDAIFVDCVSAQATPTINMGGDGPAMALRNYNGTVSISNKTGAASVELDVGSGAITLESSVTAGMITARGLAKLTDNSVGATVDDADLLQPSAINEVLIRSVWTHKILRNRMETDPVAGTITIYDDDSVTPLFVGNLWEDVAGTQPYRGLGAERRDRMV